MGMTDKQFDIFLKSLYRDALNAETLEALRNDIRLMLDEEQAAHVEKSLNKKAK